VICTWDDTNTLPYVPQIVAMLSLAVLTLRNRLLLISKLPARSVQLLPRLVLLARLKSSLVGQPDEVLVGVGGGVGSQSRSEMNRVGDEASGSRARMGRPRKTRNDNGTKRGPNKITIQKPEQAQAVTVK